MISRSIFCVLFLAALTPHAVEAKRHYGIITDLIHSPKESATIDVVTLENVQNVGYKFSVYTPSGIPFVTLTDPPVPVPDGGTFVNSASSTIPNLFTPSGGQTALVCVDTVDPQTLQPLNKQSVAVLRQRSGTSRIVMSLPPQELSAGQSFTVPIGALEAGTWLYVAAIDLDTSVWVVINNNPPTGDPIFVPAFGVVKIPMTTPNSRVVVSVAAKADGTVNPSEHVMVMLAVDSGTKVDQTILPNTY